MQNKLPKTLLNFIWYFLKDYKIAVLIFIVTSIATGFLGSINSILIKKIINLLPFVSAANLSLLFWPAILMVLNFIVVDNFTWRTLKYINYKYQGVIKNKIISEMLSYVLESQQQFFLDNFSGSISKHITTLAENIEVILFKIAKNFIKAIITLFLAFIVAQSVNYVFFYIIFLWFLIFTSFSFSMSNRFVYLSNKLAESESLLSGQILDSISNHNNIKLFETKDYELYRMNIFFKNAQEAFEKKEFFEMLLDFTQGVLIAFMLGSSLFFLVKLYGKKLITIGDFALILGLSMDLAYIIWATMFQVDDFNQAVGKCNQSLSSLIIEHEILDKKNADELLIKKGEIVFENVSFNYKNSFALFKNKSIIIKSGQKVGLVGYSGGGKSTFVNLLLRFYDVGAGKILIDGQNICDVTQESLRKNIAMIPQDPSLFHRSIIENIRYGRIDATDEEVFLAAKKAHAHEFIIKLTSGYESLVGERGVKLSGGQRQRIAIARAILKNAPILILDEATSQLDSVTENIIQDSFFELMQNKTTIVVAHRLSTLLRMDRILVFDQGKIVEDGTHGKLIARNGLYKILWDAQVGGFLLDY